MLLTDVDALYTAPPSQPGSRRVEYVPNVIDALGDIQVSGSGSKVGTGGMVTKLEAARVAAVSGIPTVLTCASNAGPAMMGDPVGTVFAPVKDRGSSPRRLWIGFASHPRGTLVVDSGAARRFAAGVPRCSRPARSKYMAIFRRRSGLDRCRAGEPFGPKASPASIPKKFRRC